MNCGINIINYSSESESDKSDNDSKCDERWVGRFKLEKTRSESDNSDGSTVQSKIVFDRYETSDSEFYPNFKNSLKFLCHRALTKELVA